MKRIFRKSKDVVARKIIDDTFLVPIRGKMADLQSMFSLDKGVASFIWENIDETKSTEEIFERVVETFDVDRERAQADLTEFFEQLVKAGLIEEVR